MIPPNGSYRVPDADEIRESANWLSAYSAGVSLTEVSGERVPRLPVAYSSPSR
jgi:hypothetical protein